MDSLNSQKAVNSHPPKVVNDQSNKNIKTSQSNQSDLKDTNFEYEDNEWDDVGIGSLIIDLDADIEKSSSTSLENNSLVIPIGSTENIATPRNTKTNKDNKSSDSDSADKAGKRKEAANMSAAANSGNKSSKISIDHQATLDKGLKMKIKRTKTGTKTSDSKHEIVKPDHNGIISSDDSISNSKKLQNAINIPSSPSSSSNSSSNKRGNNSHKKEKSKDKCGSKEKLDLPAMNQSENQACSCGSDKMGNLPSTQCNSLNCIKLRDTNLSNRVGSATNQSVSSTDKQNLNLTTPTNTSTPTGKDVKNTSSHPSASKHKDQIKFAEFSKSLSNVNNSVVMNSSSDDGKSTSSPPMKKTKCDSKGMVDVCIGTSIGTITEPDCLGPCEPGTSVTLEGIVWHETEGGVLAVNVTWRGKTYVGTLIDCTKHDWAPPRFCDSPTEELDSRLPKGGRAKRGRNSVTNNDLLNFTETRSSVHSKLRNGGSKGRASRNSSSTNINISSSAITNTPSTSPTTFSVPRPEKRRKSKDESPPFNGNQASTNPATVVAQASASKKPKSVASPCAISPVLLECPEQDCSKKYKHANGLKYHQSHAHGINADDDSLTAPESPQRSQSPEIKADDKTEDDPSLPKINFESVKPSIDTLTDTAVDRFPIMQKSSTPDAAPIFDNRPLPAKPDPSSCTANTTTKFANISDVEQTSNDSNDVQNSNFYIQNKVSNLTKKKVEQKDRTEDSNDAVGGMSSNISKPEGARSPAYSDISDDSNIATDNGMNDKHIANTDVKKPTDAGPANLSMGPYNNMYGQYYQPSSFFPPPPDSQSTKAINPPPQQPNSLMKEPSPLDLITKIPPSKSEPTIPSSPSSSVPHKLSHYQHYPYNFIQPTYPYMENNSYGNLPSDEKAPQGLQIKEEMRKESSSPDNTKAVSLIQNSSEFNESKRETHLNQQKPIKTEPKDVKLESGQPSNLQSPQHMSPYSGMYQRHLSSISREEDLQKYFIYPDQRRPPVGGTPTNPTKDERKSQSPTTPQSSSFKSKNSSSTTPSSSSKSSSTSKDIKTEEKEPKVKQEGQKPTMETQGPPPPPTSQQYYLPYGGSPFFPDPGHPMYRNMLVPPSPYNPSYHLQMARFTSPEDLSRNPNTKALDLLQQHANQYYNNHKIHELSERHSQLKSPTSNPKIPISSSPTMTGQSSTVQNANIAPSNLSGSTSSPQSVNLKTNLDKPERTELKDSIPGSGNNGSRPPSPPPQRHVHTHLHTHQLAGIGYHPYPYVNPAVLAGQQAVINPFANPPANK